MTPDQSGIHLHDAVSHIFLHTTSLCGAREESSLLWAVFACLIAFLYVLAVFKV